MKDIKKWVWQHQNYPTFPFDNSKLDDTILQLSKSVGVLEGIISTLNYDNTVDLEIDTFTNEIISTAQIEGEILSRESVRSSVCKKFDRLFDAKHDKSTHYTDGLSDIMIDSSFNKNPLTKERLHGWHNALFPTGYSGLLKIKVASYRDEEMTVISGQGIKEKIHYKAVEPKDIEMDMNRLLSYINEKKVNPFIKSAIAHLWFVIIHPYDDGNGRIARSIVNYILSKELNLNHKYFSISHSVANSKKSYYEILEKSNNLFYNRNYDFTQWILWHTNMIKNAVEISISNIQAIIKKAKFWDRARSIKLNESQIKVLNKMLDAKDANFEGGLTNKKYRNITKTTQVTASRHIQDLVKKGLLKEIKGYGGRSTRYEIAF